MNLLAFDTCFQACSVAAGHVKDGNLPSEKACEPGAFAYEAREKGHAEKLMPLVQQVLDAAGIKPDQLDGLAVTHGPGSFTGTRTSVAAARGLALALDIPIFSTTSLRVMHFTARRKLSELGYVPKDMNLAVTVDARRSATYTLYCARSCDPKDEDVVLLSLPDAAMLGAGVSDAAGHPLCFVGTAAEDVCSLAQSNGRKSEALLPDLQPDARDLWAMTAQGWVAKADVVEPLYLRPADAKPQVGKLIARVLDA